MAVDPAGRVWLSGMTSSTDLPLKNAQQGVFGGGDFDGFLAAFSADGSSLCFGSYFGGKGHDILEGLALGKQTAYVSGLSASPDIPQKGWHVQPGFGRGPFDAIVAGVPVDGCR
jgi:hypothetical protein